MTTFVTFKVGDVNDNLPYFDEDYFSFIIPENLPAGYFVGVVHATDLDVADKVIYSVGQNDFLSIDSDSGHVILKKSIDYEEGFHKIVILRF